VCSRDAIAATRCGHGCALYDTAAIARVDDKSRYAHDRASNMLRRFVAGTVQPLLLGCGRDLAVSGSKRHVASRHIAVLLLHHRLLELHMWHADAASETGVKVFYATARQLGDVELAGIRFHLCLCFKLRSKRTLQLLAQC
jgi:hypothetical protein